MSASLVILIIDKNFDEANILSQLLKTKIKKVKIIISPSISESVEYFNKKLGVVDNSLSERLRPVDCQLKQESLINTQPYCAKLAPAGSSEHATRRKKSNCQQPLIDVILIDPYLVDNQGIESFRMLNLIASSIPIIIVSRLNNDALAISTLKEGAQDYFCKKNCDAKMLTRSIKYSIERKKHEQHIKSNSTNKKFAALQFSIQSQVANILAKATNMHSTTQNILTAICEAFGYSDMEDKLLYIANHDLLTGLVNKFHTESVLDSLINQAKQNKTMIAFLYFDLDYFKQINELLGHYNGDLLLQKIAFRIQQETRYGDLVARFGGDEFVVLLQNIKSKSQIDIIAKKILKSIEKPIKLENQKYYITASMGISIYPNNGDNLESLFNAADSSMYEIKHSCKGSYKYVDSGYSETEKRALIMSTMLHQAIEKREFILYYQPIVDVKSNKILSAEALIRWKPPSGEIILPSEFIHKLETTNMILKVGLWSIKTACQQIKKWGNIGFNSVTVNISVRQLNENLLPIIETILNETGIRANQLILEITESMLMQQTFVILNALHILNKMGVVVSIDDFGTGYSSLAYLKMFKIQSIKIDKSFIASINDNQSSKSIVKAIILMANTLGLKTIAEGVEKKEQLDFLKENNCDMYQGYYYCKPLPPDELNRWIKEH